MSETDTFEHIRKINDKREAMEKYNGELICLFGKYLADSTIENIMNVCELEKTPIAGSSYNTYRYVRNIHRISNIVVKELSIGYIPLTKGTHKNKEAIDKYRKTTFMLRRRELMQAETDQEYVDEAVGYIIAHEISPVAIHDILVDDICFDGTGVSIAYWAQKLSDAGREKDALLLERMP